jgi:ATP-dependent protease HslVU (ClpYQ) peptidase subunit
MGPPNQKAYRKENENVIATDIQVELGQTSETAETGIK